MWYIAMFLLTFTDVIFIFIFCFIVYYTACNTFRMFEKPFCGTTVPKEENLSPLGLKPPAYYVLKNHHLLGHHV